MKGLSYSASLIAALAISTASWSANASDSQRVVLGDGKAYTVETQDGMPLPFKSRQLDVTGLGPFFGVQSGQMQWAFTAVLHEKGHFSVTVRSPMDKTLSAAFEVVGPGNVMEIFFDKSGFPRAWDWYNDPGTSWIPFVFTFRNIETGRTFEAIQWTKFDPSVKVTVKRKLKNPG